MSLLRGSNGPICTRSPRTLSEAAPQKCLPVRIYTLLPEDLTAIEAKVREAEALGYDGVIAMEVQHDPYFLLLLAAEHSQRLLLTTNVAVAFPRSPMNTAYLGWDLQNFSGGRFIVGLGPQVKAHNERRYSVAWSAPGPRLREYLLALSAIWDCWQNNTPLQFEGEHYHFNLMTPRVNPGPIGYRQPPLHISAVGPYMCRLVGEIGDGIRSHPLTTRKFAEEVMLPLVEAGAKKAGRSLEEIDVFGGGFVAVGATADECQRLREEIRATIAFYGSTRSYHHIFQLHGWQEMGPSLHELSMRGRWDEMASLVPDEVLDEIAVVAGYDDVVKQVEKRFGSYATSLEVAIPARTPVEARQARRVIAALKGLGRQGPR